MTYVRQINSLCFILMIGFCFLLTFNVFAIDSPDELVEKVRSRIANHYVGYEGLDIRADQDGTVYLEGDVDILYDKYRIHEIVSKVKGVRAISNQLIVKAPLLPDKIIKDNIRDEMQYLSSIKEADRITVEVDNGIVFF